MTTPEHPLREALDEVAGAALYEVVRDRENGVGPDGEVESMEAFTARLSRLVEAAIVHDEAREAMRECEGIDAEFVLAVEASSRAHDALIAAIRCEGENDDAPQD